MSFRHSNASQGSDEFHKDAEADYSLDISDERKEKRKEPKKFLFKKESKDKGYSTLSADQSQDSVFLVNTKNAKKTKTDNKIATLNVFKKSFKDEKKLKEIKEGKDAKDEPKRSKKVKETRKKEHLFGNYLENAVNSFPCNDGVRIPAPIRICLDIIEQKGIEQESIYRRSINKSVLESICDSINKDKFDSRIEELNADPMLACAIIKKFLREIKSALIPDEFVSSMDKCDASISDKDVTNKVEHLKKIVFKLPPSNFDTFSYLIMHFHRVLNKSDINKIEIGYFVQKFQPIFRIRERLFRFCVLHADSLFSDYRFKKYKSTKANEEAMSRFSLLPDNIEDLEKEIAKQDAYLSELHSRIANEENSVDKAVQEQLSDELWALQRYVTTLKRKVKKLKLERKQSDSAEAKPSTQVPNSSSTSTIKNEDGSGVGSSTNVEYSKQEDEQQQTQGLNLNELVDLELNMLCENFVIIENLQKLIERLNREKSLVNDLQQQIICYNPNDMVLMNLVESLSFEELIANEQLISNENKLLEERINLINKRINNEKEKIFELKLNINLKTIQCETTLATMPNPFQTDVDVLAKVNLPSSKDLVMTKL